MADAGDDARREEGTRPEKRARREREEERAGAQQEGRGAGEIKGVNTGDGGERDLGGGRQERAQGRKTAADGRQAVRGGSADGEREGVKAEGAGGVGGGSSGAPGNGERGRRDEKRSAGAAASADDARKGVGEGGDGGGGRVQGIEATGARREGSGAMTDAGAAVEGGGAQAVREERGEKPGAGGAVAARREEEDATAEAVARTPGVQEPRAPTAGATAATGAADGRERRASQTVGEAAAAARVAEPNAPKAEEATAGRAAVVSGVQRVGRVAAAGVRRTAVAGGGSPPRPGGGVSNAGAAEVPKLPAREAVLAPAGLRGPRRWCRPSAAATRARWRNQAKLQRLPGCAEEWAEDVDDAMGAEGEWVEKHLDIARRLSGAGGVAVCDAGSGICTSMYAAFSAGLKVEDFLSFDNDEHGIDIHLQQVGMMTALNDRGGDLIPDTILKNMRRHGDDIMAFTEAQARAWVRAKAVTAALVVFLFSWPCGENSVAKGPGGQYLWPDPRRKTDLVVEHCAKLLWAMHAEAEAAGVVFVAFGENTPTWMTGDDRYEVDMSKEEQEARKKQLAWLHSIIGLSVLDDAANMSGLHRLRQVHPTGVKLRPMPRMEVGRDYVDVLDAHQRPQQASRPDNGNFAKWNVPHKMKRKGNTAMRTWATTDSNTKGARPGLVFEGRGVHMRKEHVTIGGLMRSVGFYAPWLARDSITSTTTLMQKGEKRADDYMRQAYGNVIDAQFATWLMAQAAWAWDAARPADASAARGERERAVVDRRDAAAPDGRRGAEQGGSGTGGGAGSASAGGSGGKLREVPGPPPGRPGAGNRAAAGGARCGDNTTAEASVVTNTGAAAARGDAGLQGGRRRVVMPLWTNGHVMQVDRSGGRDPEDHRFMLWGNHAVGEWKPKWDTCCLDSGDNMEPGCEEFLCPARPIEKNFEKLVGSTFIANLPFNKVERLVPYLHAAVMADPQTTRGLVLAPVRDAPWYRRWVACKHPLLREVRTWPPGCFLFDYRSPDGKRHRSKATQERIGLYKIGWAPSEIQGRAEEAAASLRKARRAEGERTGRTMVRRRDKEAEKRSGGGARGEKDDEAEALAAELALEEEAEEGPAGSGDDDKQAPLAERRAARATAVHLLREWLDSAGYRDCGETIAAWARCAMTGGAGDPTAWYVPRAGLVGDTTARLQPRRWAYWCARLGDDAERGAVAAEAAAIAAGGARVPLAYAVPWCEHSNAKSCTQYADRIVKELDWYEKAKVHEWCPDGVSKFDFVARVQAALVAVRYPDDGKGRLCLSFSKSGLTKAIMARSFKQPTVSQFLRGARKGDWFMRKDIAKAFYNMKLEPEARKLTGFVCPRTGRLGRYTAPVFGLRNAPEILYVMATTLRLAVQVLAGEAAAMLRGGAASARGDGEGRAVVKGGTREGSLQGGAEETQAGVDCAGRGRGEERADELERAAGSLDPYADDFVGCGAPWAIMAVDLIITLESEKLGLMFDHGKDVAGPEIVVLGAKLSSISLSLTIADKKRKAYLEFIKDFLGEHEGKATCKRKWLERLRGRLGFCAQLSRWASIFLPEIDAALYPPGWKGQPPQTCVLGEALITDLKDFWLQFLGTENAPWLVRSQWSTLPAAEAMTHAHYVQVSDASGRWGAGGVTMWENFARRWGDRELPLHINVKELIAAADMAIVRMADYAGGRLVMESDNKGAIGYINKGTAGLPEARHVLRSLAGAAIQHNVEVRARYRPGKAMGPSRG